MYEIIESDEFSRWLRKLKSRDAKGRILLRLRRIEENGALGKVKSCRDGVSELIFDFGPGYRVYHAIENGQVFLCSSTEVTRALRIKT